MGILFQYNNPDTSAAPGNQLAYRSLALRLNPNEVSWNYNLNTQTYDTYGGQVVQVLSVNIDSLTISGQLGKEGPFGIYKVGGQQKDDRYQGPVPAGGFSTKYVDRQFDYNGETYPGLHAMLEFFREYFALVSQGGDPQNPGQFVQVPMLLTYDGAPTDQGQQKRTWTITPTQFPNFRRALDNFAPEWQIVAAVIEPPAEIVANQTSAAINRLQAAIGYKVRNPFSDPNASGQSDTSSINAQIASQFKALLPDYSKGEIEDMIWKGISVPSIDGVPGATQSQITLDNNASNLMAGEVGINASTAQVVVTATANSGAPSAVTGA